MQWVLVLELDRMNGVDNERRIDLALDKLSTCVLTVFLPLWFLVCTGAAGVVLKIEVPLAMFCFRIYWPTLKC